MKRVTLNCQKELRFYTSESIHTKPKHKSTRVCLRDAANRDAQGPSWGPGQQSPGPAPGCCLAEESQAQGRCPHHPQAPQAPALHPAQKPCLQIPEKGESTCLTMKH